MQTVLIVFHVLTAVAMVAIVLVQRGAGATAGAAFGAGASATVFGSRGSGSFLTRATAILATGFFLISLTLAIIASRIDDTNDDLGVMSNVTVDPTGLQGEGGGEEGDMPSLEAALESLEDGAAGEGSEGDVPLLMEQPATDDTNSGSDVPAMDLSSDPDAAGEGAEDGATDAGGEN